MASMSNVLQHQHQDMLSAFEILENLKQLFGDQGRSAKQTVMRTLMNTKMVEGTLVRDHVLKMIGLLNELEVLGAEINNDSQVEMILQFLPDSFQQFCLNNNMNKMSLSLAQLLNELQAAETLVKKQAPSMVLNVEKGSTFKSKGGQKKKKAHKAKAIAPLIGGMKKPKGKCFHCKMSGHWRAHCPDFLAYKKNNQGNSLSLVVETFLADVSTTSWCVDSGATDHICSTLQGFQDTRKLIKGEVNVFQADGSSAPVLALGNITFSFDSGRVLILKDVLYVPEVRRNLISYSKVLRDGYDVNFSYNGCVISYNKHIVSTGTLIDGLFIINVSQELQQTV
ncbi:hypothetical protein KY284_035331 [Solanum tuberosum]|nr:hypothetical protein KY284_035331 [Solanum tuberosum]